MSTDHQNSINEYHNVGLVRTDMYCHDCDKNFIATLDYNIDGNHEIICPHCGHEHCRVIEKGIVTSDRWDSRYGNNIETDTQKTWSHNSLKVNTSSTSHFLRNRWLNREY